VVRALRVFASPISRFGSRILLRTILVRRKEGGTGNGTIRRFR
jgi:hypothetical protein